MRRGDTARPSSPWLDVARGRGDSRAETGRGEDRRDSGSTRSPTVAGGSGPAGDVAAPRAVRADGGTVRVAVNGATGRMGRAVVETAAERADLTVTFGVDEEPDTDADPPIYDPGTFPSALMNHGADVVVDFSTPRATAALAELLADEDVALVTGTTGLEDDHLRRLEDASTHVPVLRASNFARGVHALLAALDPALATLPDYDVELSETHHNAKTDAPSGTAKTILRAIRDERDLDPVYGREGHAPRSADEIGVQVSRLGDVRGEHEVRLGGNDEVLTIAHRAEDRAVFAAGALDAAAWVAGRNPGWYTFGDVIGDR